MECSFYVQFLYTSRYSRQKHSNQLESTRKKKKPAEIRKVNISFTKDVPPNLAKKKKKTFIIMKLSCISAFVTHPSKKLTQTKEIMLQTGN